MSRLQDGSGISIAFGHKGSHLVRCPIESPQDSTVRKVTLSSIGLVLFHIYPDHSISYTFTYTKTLGAGMMRCRSYTDPSPCPGLSTIRIHPVHFVPSYLSSILVPTTPIKIMFRHFISFRLQSFLARPSVTLIPSPVCGGKLGIACARACFFA